MKILELNRETRIVTLQLAQTELKALVGAQPKTTKPKTGHHPCRGRPNARSSTKIGGVYAEGNGRYSYAYYIDNKRTRGSFKTLQEAVNFKTTYENQPQ